LAEMYERLAKAERHWQAQQTESARELEMLAADLQRREDDLGERGRSTAAASERVRQERKAVILLRRELKRGLAELVTQQIMWQGERDRQLTEVEQRNAAAERRERAHTALFRRWRDRRAAELQQLQQMLEAGATSRQAWAEQRNEWQRRSDSLRAAQQAIVEQELVLEQARQELLEQTDPAAATKRLERLRRRWEGLSKTSRGDLDKRRAQLNADQAALDERFARLQRQTAEAARCATELADERTEAEAQRLHYEEQNHHLDTVCATWRDQQRLYERQLAQLKDEADQLARLLIGDEMDSEPLKAAA